MLTNTGVTEGFRKIKYPKNRKARAPITYHHVNDPAGICFSIFVQLIAEEILHGAQAQIMNRKFKEAGLTKEKLFAAVKQRLPAYASYYEKMSGRQFKPETVYHRFHKKQAYRNGPNHSHGKGQPTQSGEHYTASKKLRPHVPKVEVAFRSGKILTLKQMRALVTVS